MSVRPRSLAHRGSVVAAGFFFPIEHMGEAEARRRILALWRPGAEVYRLADGLLLRLPGGQPVRAGETPGVPLVALPILAGRILSAAPLTTQELEQLQPPPGAVLFVNAGAAAAQVLTSDQQEDLATWLDFSAWHAVAEARSLAASVPGPMAAVEPIEFDPRTRFHGVPPADPGATDVLEAFRRGPTPGDQAGIGSRFRGALEGISAAAALGLAGIRDAIGRIGRTEVSSKSNQASHSSYEPAAPPAWLLAPLGLVAMAVGSFLSIMGIGGNGAGTPPPPSAAPARPKSPSGLMTRFNRMLSRLTMNSQLGRVIGNRQAQYVTRMMELFERGELTDALRHAIPLGGVGDPGTPFAMGVPKPRADLNISPQLFSGGSSLGAAGLLYSELEKLYRQAFERLRDLGRIDEAAFVLAELLHVDQEAVAFLETHGKLRLAAEMAEARNLPDGLVVRQWWLAGDRKRAIAIARRSGAFADAVTRLEQSDPASADALRLEWAESLAAAGNYAQAIEAIWPVVEKRTAAQSWMDCVIALGGTAGARMLARKVVLVPEAATELRASLLALLDEDGSEAASARRTFADTLRQGERTPLAGTFARAAARALARDAASGMSDVSSTNFRKLVEFSGDAALRADSPVLPARSYQKLNLLMEPREWNIEGGDVGMHPIHDAAYLPDGKCVVALGEAGVRLISREGRTIAHFDQPAQRLVLSDHGDRVIALAERGDIYRLARIDLLSRKAHAWCEAELDTFAESFDGSVWLVGVKGALVALDATVPGLTSLWTTRDVGRRIVTIARNLTHASLLAVRDGTTDNLGRAPVDTEESWERWTYDLPSLVLRYRTPLEESGPGIGTVRRVSPTGTVIDVKPYATTDGGGLDYALTVDGLEMTTDGTSILKASADHDFNPRFDPVLTDEWVAFVTSDEAPLTCRLVDLQQRRIRAKICLEGARRVRLRLQESVLTITDDQSRLLVLGLDHGRTLRDLRVR